MRINAARFDNGELHLRVDVRDGKKFCYQFKEGDFDIAPSKKKRSMNANAYAWVLIDKIALELKLTPDEVYRNAIADMPGVSDPAICISEAAAESFKRVWCSGHLGRQCREFPSNVPGWVNIICVYGSSDYDTKQMSVFIDRLIQDAKALGIETLPPDKLDAMLGAWG